MSRIKNCVHITGLFQAHQFRYCKFRSDILGLYTHSKDVLVEATFLEDEATTSQYASNSITDTATSPRSPLAPHRALPQNLAVHLSGTPYPEESLPEPNPVLRPAGRRALLIQPPRSRYSIRQPRITHRNMSRAEYPDLSASLDAVSKAHLLLPQA